MKDFHFLLVILIMTSCGDQQTTKNDPQKVTTTIHLDPVQIKTAGISSEKVRFTSATGTLSASGMLEVPPQNLVSISIPWGGYVRETELLPGMRVQKGDVLAVLEHPDYIQLQQDYLDNEEKVKLAFLESQRQDQLHAGQAGIEKLREQAGSNLNQLRIVQKSLGEQLKLLGLNPASLKAETISGKISLRSPANGFVKAVHANIGRYAGPTDVLFEIIDTEHMHVELRVFEKDMGRVKTGQKITFTLPGEHPEQRSAHVYLVGKALNDDHTIVVHGHLDKEDPALIPGVFVNAQIETGTDSVPAVPERAIAWLDGKPVLFIDEGAGNFRWIAINTGNAVDGLVPVSQPENEPLYALKVVVSGTRSLLGVLSGGSEGH